MLALSGRFTLASLLFVVVRVEETSKPRRALLTGLLQRVLESIKAGKRLPEARFATLKMASAGQGSVYHDFAAAAATKNSTAAPSSSRKVELDQDADADVHWVPPSGQPAVE